jgi:Tfp pilus assembly protein PilN
LAFECRFNPRIAFFNGKVGNILKIRGEYLVFPLNASKINPWIQTEKKHRKKRIHRLCWTSATTDLAAAYQIWRIADAWQAKFCKPAG